MRAWIGVCVLAGCYAGVDAESRPLPVGMHEPEPESESESESEPESESESESDSGSDSDSDSDSALDALEPPCAYTLVHEQPGLLLTVSPDASELELQPLQPGEGFFCMRVEFDLQTLDNLDTLAEEHDACPERTAIAAVYGSAAQGEFLASAFFGHYDASCERIPDTLEVGNFLHYAPSVPGPWPPGKRWHVVLEMRPFVSRISILRNGELVGPRVEASLFPANIEDTRDPVVRLGQARITAGRFFPWYGATYENLRIEADVAPAAP